MVWPESFSLCWLFPLVMIFLCLLMCGSRWRTGMLGCCGGWGEPRDTWRGPPADSPGGGQPGDAEAPAGEETGVEGLRSTVERLERRLRNLEEGTRQEESDGG